MSIDSNSEQLNSICGKENLPKQWAFCSLGDLLTRLSNGANVTQYKEKVGFPITRIETISNEIVDESRVRYIFESSEEFVEKYSIEYQDILLSHINSDLHLGKTAIYRGKPQVLIHGMNLLLLRSSEYIYSDYLNYQLKYLRVSGVFIKIAQRAVNQSSINQSKLKNIQIKVAPLSEQHRIVEKIEELFSDLDKGVESLKTTQQQLKIYRQAVLKWAFEGKLTAKWREEKKQQGELKSAGELLVQIKAEREKRDLQQLQEWNEAVKDWEANGKQGKKPGKPRKVECISHFTDSQIEALSVLPDSWMWAKLGNLTMFSPRNGYSPKPVSYPTGVKSLSLSATTSGKFDRQYFKYIDEEIAVDSYLWLKPGDVLIQRGNTIEYVGIAAKYKGDSSEFIYPDLMMKIQFAESLNTDYFHLVINSQRARTFFKERATGTAGTMPKINKATVNNLPIPLPSFAEQHQIVQEIEFRLSICDRLEATITENLQRAEALRQSILKQAFEGKLVPQDPNDEPAEQLIERIRQEKLNGKNGKQLELEIFVDGKIE